MSSARLPSLPSDRVLPPRLRPRSVSVGTMLHPQGQAQLKHDILKGEDVEPRGRPPDRGPERELRSPPYGIYLGRHFTDLALDPLLDAHLAASLFTHDEQDVSVGDGA